jgi:hypothetical protein
VRRVHMPRRDGNTYTCVRVYTYMYSYFCMYACMCMCVYMHICVYTCVFSYVFVYINNSKALKQLPVFAILALDALIMYLCRQ